MSSGSCPLCLTPPCYTFRAAARRLNFLRGICPPAGRSETRTIPASPCTEGVLASRRISHSARSRTVNPNQRLPEPIQALRIIMVGLNRKASSRRNEARIGWETINVLEPDVMFREEAADPIHFGRTFVNSDAFKALFQEGMELVEETAAYLDGAGREDSRRAIPPGHAHLCKREHAADHAADADRVVAARPTGRRGRGDHAGPGQGREEPRAPRRAGLRSPRPPISRRCRCG